MNEYKSVPFYIAMKTILIYQIMCLQNNRKYIGSTSKSLSSRMSSHLCDLRKNKHSIPLLQADWNELSEKAFKWDVLEICSEHDRKGKENYWIDVFTTINPECGYNRVKAFQSASKLYKQKTGRYPREGIPNSEESKRKVSLSLMGHVITEETRKKLIESHLGQKAWNKGSKGLMKPNITSFKLGGVAPNKGRKKMIIDGKIRMVKPKCQKEL